MAVEYEISFDVATIKDVAPNTQVARVVSLYSGQITYDDEAGSKFATATIDGKSQRVMLCIAVNGTVNYDDTPCLYSTVDGHRCLNIVAPTETGTPDDVPSVYETVVIDGMNVRAVRCILINETPIYDGVSSTCTFVANGKTHTAQLVNQVGSSSIETIVKGVAPLSLPDAIANSLSYVKAFGGTEQRNLPDNYIERQFIYMMDGSYLTTDIVPESDMRIEMDFATTSISPLAHAYFGCRTMAGGVEGIGLLHTASSSGGYIVTDGFVDGGRYVSNYVPVANTRYKYVYNASEMSLSTGGTIVVSNTFTPDSTVTTPITINAFNDNGLVSTNREGIYLYSFKVWNAQGVLVADYVPAIQKGTVPIVGFYDTVSKTFKTATAGTFAAGGEAVPTPDTPMNIVTNNGAIKARHQSGLPLGYTLLDSVVFDSTQVIDTGFTPDTNSRIESKCYRTGTTACWFYGAGAANPRVTLYLSDAGICRWGYQSRSNFGFSSNIEYTLIEDKNGLTINGTLYPWNSGTTDDFTCDITLTIGNSNGSTGTRYFAGNLYYMKIYDNDVLARDFVPCKNALNVVGLYDRVNGVFYTDAGLVAGNPVSDPVEIYADGTVETINAHGKNLYNPATTTDDIILTDSGAETPNAGGSVSDYIKIKPNTTYTLSFVRTDERIYTRVCTYSADKTFVGLKVKDIFATAGHKTYTFTTEATAEYVRFCFKSDSTDVQLEQGSTATEYAPYYDGGTATAEMLLKVGDYQDEQEILSGTVTRNVGVKVLDGTEDWQNISGYFNLSKTDLGSNSTVMPSNSHNIICSHFETKDGTFTDGIGIGGNYVNFKYDSITTTLANWKTWLAAQYAAGTPVIVVYPLATPTTESVAGQTLQVTDGDNVLEITQASLTGLELEAKYSKSA